MINMFAGMTGERSKPSFCWLCMKQLQRKPGKGQFFFALYREKETGIDHRVHIACKEREQTT